MNSAAAFPPLDAPRVQAVRAALQQQRAALFDALRVEADARPVPQQLRRLA